MRHQERGSGYAGSGVREAARDQVDTDGNERAYHAVGPSRGCEIGLIWRGAVTPIPVPTEVEVVKPVGVKVTPLQGQSETHQVRPKGRLPNHELALSPELTSGVAELFQKTSAMHPARLITMELCHRDRAEIDPKGNEKYQAGEQGVPAREHGPLLRGHSIEHIEESGERLGHAFRIAQADAGEPQRSHGKAHRHAVVVIGVDVTRLKRTGCDPHAVRKLVDVLPQS